MKSKIKIVGALTIASFAVTAAGHADSTWNGLTSTDVTVGSNYDGSTAPTFGTPADLGILHFDTNSSSNPFTYTSAQGSSNFDNVYLYDSGGKSNGVLSVTGGALTVNDNLESGQQAPATISVSGTGVLNSNGGGGGHFWVGNNSVGTLNISGSGQVNVGTQLQIARDGGQGVINISGNGLLDLTYSGGMSLAANGGTSLVSSINLSNNGIYEQTGTGAFTFANNGASLFVNFAGTSNTAEFSLLGDSSTILDSYITSGDFQINGFADANVSDYTVIGAANSSSQGIVELASAAVPEPSTWALMLGGLGVLVLIQRKRFSEV